MRVNLLDCKLNINHLVIVPRKQTIPRCLISDLKIISSEIWVEKIPSCNFSVYRSEWKCRPHPWKKWNGTRQVHCFKDVKNGKWVGGNMLEVKDLRFILENRRRLKGTVTLQHVNCCKQWDRCSRIIISEELISGNKFGKALFIQQMFTEQFYVPGTVLGSQNTAPNSES